MVAPGVAVLRVALFCASVLLIVIGGIAYRRRPGRQVTAYGLVLLSAGAGGLVRLSTFVPAIEEVALVVAGLPLAVFVPAWIVFTLFYSGYDEYLTRFSIGVVFLGSSVYSLTLGLDSLGEVGDPFLLFGVVGFVLIAGSLFVGAAVTVAGALRYEYVDTPSGILLSFGALSVFFGPITALNAGGTYVQGQFVGLLLLAAGAVVSLRRGDVLDVTPAAATIGRSAAFADVRDAVIVVDDAGRIADVNRAAEWTFDTSLAAIGGQHLSALVGDRADDLGEPGKSEFVHDTPRGRRHLEATVSRVSDGDGQSVGRTLIMRDVTERVTRKQQIQVLNRVLRHNLRNRATEIVLTAELVASGEEPPERATDVVDSMDALLSVGEQARELEEALGDDEGTSATDVGPALEHVARRLDREFDAASIEVASTADVEVAANPRIVELVLWQLGSNGVEHNDGDEPTVSLSVECDDDVVRVRVADDGPGIPSAERSVIESGAETPLEHSTGIGLWTINWLVVHSGGDLTFEDDDEWGTVATVTLPLASTARRRPPGDLDVAPDDDPDEPPESSGPAPRESPSVVDRLVHFLRSHPDRGT